MFNHQAVYDFGALRSAVELACQPQNAHRILAGRQQVLAFPRHWVIGHVEEVAKEVLNLDDYWEYRRLLELVTLLSSEILQRFVAHGLMSDDSDVREAAEDYRETGARL